MRTSLSIIRAEIERPRFTMPQRDMRANTFGAFCCFVSIAGRRDVARYRWGFATTLICRRALIALIRADVVVGTIGKAELHYIVYPVISSCILQVNYSGIIYIFRWRDNKIYSATTPSIRLRISRFNSRRFRLSQSQYLNIQIYTLLRLAIKHYLIENFLLLISSS